METNGESVVAARQPLFDADRRVLGYEIRSEGPVSGVSVDSLTGGRMAFVRISPEDLVAGKVDGLQAGQVVLQVPGDIDPTPEVREACAELRRRGFRIALDRFVPADDLSPLMRYVDFLTTEVAGAAAVVERPVASLRPTHQPSIVAVGVDSVEDFDATRGLGCDSFQGEFIARPKLTATSNIPANRLTYIRLLKAVQNPELSVIELEELIKPDAAFCLRVLRAVNGAAYAQQTRITSLRQALLLVGVGTVREWATAWAVSQVGHGVPGELIVMASVRGRFCELMSRGSIASTGGDGFLLGMCSLLDAILQSPMPAILKHLALCESNEAALRGEHNGQRALLDCAIAYERGQWEHSRRLAAGAGLDATLLPAAYNGAMSWMARFQELTMAA
jgi:EAL and modified HD-GYP domain-containing signal transduction protein